MLSTAADLLPVASFLHVRKFTIADSVCVSFFLYIVLANGKDGICNLVFVSCLIDSVLSSDAGSKLA
ncbi:hypothetical protein L6452_04563 [Arctium lappa]|uniref:Uncharacterized protein n=1 Tax=Arctium lappa TaxID=4217 RepID=A0ACB9EEA7_ARCLA|nr:hypothetical protein L6452_04563 [Arctium lappa]